MNKITLISFVTICVLFVSYLVISTKKSDQENINRQFSGIVTSVKYDEKNIPFIIVKAKEYYLDAGYNFEQKIAKGDSISKSKGSNVYKLIKTSGKVLLFKN